VNGSCLIFNAKLVVASRSCNNDKVYVAVFVTLIFYTFFQLVVTFKVLTAKVGTKTKHIPVDVKLSRKKASNYGKINGEKCDASIFQLALFAQNSVTPYTVALVKRRC